jgi:predicted small lipoprotein YifL
MKRLISIVLILVMALTVLTGCGNTSPQANAPAASDKPKEAKDTIVFAQGADITSLDMLCINSDI